MRVLIAPDSYKGSMEAIDVAKAIGRGIADAGGDIMIMPMADGGEGTVRALVSATKGTHMLTKVTGPLGRPVMADWGMSGDSKTAFIEMASASGLPLVGDNKNPLITTTFGTGQLILAALQSGASKIILGIGGSATVDGGQGMLQALGVRFLDEHGQSVKLGGGYLSDIVTIDVSQMDKRICDLELLVACDVDNPLCGKNGAAYIYGPQKGADDAMVRVLEDNLAHYAKLIKEQLDIDIIDLPGAGAAGGLGAGLVAFLNGKLKPGVEIVAEAVQLDLFMSKADLVITGEGNTDSQTVHGKVAVGVAAIAKKYDIPVICLSGGLGDGYQKVYEHGITACFSIMDKPMSLDEAMEDTESLLYNAAFALGNILAACK